MQPPGPPLPPFAPLPPGGGYGPPQGAPPPPYYPPQLPYGAPMYGPPAPTEGKATVSLVLGVVSLVGTCCYLGFLLGIPAIVVGFLARRDIARSGGALGGSGAALGGIICGALGTLVNIAQIAFFAATMLMGAHSSKSSPSPYSPSSPVHVSPTTPLKPPPVPTAAPTYTTPHNYGRVHVTTMARGQPLRAQLAAEVAKMPHGQKLVVMTTATWSKDASEIEATIANPKMQAALSGVWIARVDADDFKTDLAAMGLERPEVPWFFMLDAKLAVTSDIGAGEWDANIAANIAPVMKRFVEGTLAPPNTQGKPAPTGTTL